MFFFISTVLRDWPFSPLLSHPISPCVAFPPRDEVVASVLHAISVVAAAAEAIVTGTPCELSTLHVEWRALKVCGFVGVG